MYLVTAGVIIVTYVLVYRAFTTKRRDKDQELADRLLQHRLHNTNLWRR